MLSPIFCVRENIVVLHGQHSLWANVQVGIPRGSILGSLYFLIYINDLSESLNSNAADNTSLFSVAENINSTGSDLNTDLIRVATQK